MQTKKGSRLENYLLAMTNDSANHHAYTLQR